MHIHIHILIRIRISEIIRKLDVDGPVLRFLSNRSLRQTLIEPEPFLKPA